MTTGWRACGTPVSRPDLVTHRPAVNPSIELATDPAVHFAVSAWYLSARTVGGGVSPCSTRSPASGSRAATLPGQEASGLCGLAGNGYERVNIKIKAII